jgi:hypothetical protein
MSRLNLSLAMLLLPALVTLLYGQSAVLPPGPMQPKVKTACLECHDAHIIVQQRMGKAAWTKEVDKMIKWGALVEPGDRDTLIEYLSTNFPAEKEPYKPSRTIALSNKK